MPYTEMKDFEGFAMIDCKLCADLEARVGRALWNEPLIETEHFAVIPSLGALVKGWLLLLPKKHHISMGALPTGLRAEADELEGQTRALLAARYRTTVVVFEHGPSAERHGTGCGVDHAHLHLLPFDCDLLSYARPFVPVSVEWKSCNWEERAEAYRSGLDYLYFRPEGKGGQIAVCKDFGSQVFRKAVSSYLRVENEFNWRAYPRIETVAQTIEDLMGASVMHARRGGAEHVA